METTGDSSSQASSFTDDEKKQPPPSMRQSGRRQAPIPTPPFLNKFATMATDKYTQSLRRDLLLSNFDRNLTVEQAHFDPSFSLGVPHDNPPVTGSPSLTNSLSSSTLNDNNNVNSNGNSNNHATDTNPYSGLLSSNVSGTHSPPLGPMLTPPAEAPHLSRRSSNNKLDAKRKQSKRAPIHSTATPSEYFHRNLVDAVSNVEDSDENEYYVYPYSGGEHNASDYYSPSAPRSLRSKKSSIAPLRSTLSSHELKHGSNKPHRPKLRSYVLDPHATKKEYAAAARQDPQLRSARRNQPRRYPYYQPATDGYASDDEGESLLWNDDQRRQRRHRCHFSLWSLLLSLALLFLFGGMVLLYGGAKPLQDVTISMGRVLASDKELIFDLHVTAYNPNGWTVHVAEADISVFAFSRIVPLLSPDVYANQSSSFSSSSYSVGADPAEYLGGFYHFDEPLAFSSSLLSCQPSQAVSQIRIKSPGDDQGGNERWSRMIRYSYGLLARGVLSYRSLGLPGVHSQTVDICNVAKVDPITGVVSGDPDQGYCANAS